MLDGQTGSGKTFTMEGYDDPGVTPRAMMELFRQLDELRGEWTYTLTLSILEIYNESIHDLLNNNNAGKEKEKLDIRQTPDGNTVPGLTEIPVSKYQLCMIPCLEMSRNAVFWCRCIPVDVS